MKAIISIDIGLAGGITIFEQKDNICKIVDCIKMPIVKIETKPAKFKFNLLNGKKQYYKTGSEKGKPKIIQTSPAEYSRELDIHRVLKIFNSYEAKTIVFEEPGISAGNAAKATATTNRNYGKLLALAEISKANIVTVPANKWKKDLGLTKDKLQCVEFAEKIFNMNFRTKNNALLDGQAESALIGYWYITENSNK